MQSIVLPDVGTPIVDLCGYSMPPGTKGRVTHAFQSLDIDYISVNWETSDSRLSSRKTWIDAHAWKWGGFAPVGEKEAQKEAILRYLNNLNDRIPRDFCPLSIQQIRKHWYFVVITKCNPDNLEAGIEWFYSGARTRSRAYRKALAEAARDRTFLYEQPDMTERLQQIEAAFNSSDPDLYPSLCEQASLECNDEEWEQVLAFCEQIEAKHKVAMH